MDDARDRRRSTLERTDGWRGRSRLRRAARAPARAAVARGRGGRAARRAPRCWPSSPACAVQAMRVRPYAWGRAVPRRGRRRHRRRVGGGARVPSARSPRRRHPDGVAWLARRSTSGCEELPRRSAPRSPSDCSGSSGTRRDRTSAPRAPGHPWFPPPCGTRLGAAACRPAWPRRASRRSTSACSTPRGRFARSGWRRPRPPGRWKTGWSFIDAIDWWDADDGMWRPGGSSHAAGRGRLGVAVAPTRSSRRCRALPGRLRGRRSRRLSPRRQLAADGRAGGLVGAGRRGRLGVRVHRARAGAGIADALTVAPTPWLTANRCWSALTLAAEDETWPDLTSLLQRGAVPVDHICAELGPGCLELATGPRGRGALGRRCRPGQALHQGVLRPPGPGGHLHGAARRPSFPGLGGHPSLSLRSGVDGTPRSVDDAGRPLQDRWRRPSPAWSRLLPELLALVAPSPNSYRRFGPGNWAPSTATWGVGQLQLRAARAVRDDPSAPASSCASPGADVSPHLCLAMFLGAALWGIERAARAPAAGALRPLDGRLARGCRPAPPRPRRGGRSLRGQRGGPWSCSARASSSTTPRRVRAEDAACQRFVSGRGAGPLSGPGLRRPETMADAGPERPIRAEPDVRRFAEDGFVVCRAHHRSAHRLVAGRALRRAVRRPLRDRPAARRVELAARARPRRT